MATPNRSALISRTLRVLKKHYKPVAPPKDRTVFENVLYGCLLEDSPYEAADRVFETLKRDYFDWNEVRVSTVRELAEVLKPLNKPEEAAARLKQSLHAVFESVYQFDLESMKKQNLGQAVKQLQKYNGTTPFVVAYVTQSGLGGHAIPVNRGLLLSFHVVGVISDAEAAAGNVPGLERTISKNKGFEAGSLFHQLGVEVGNNPYGQTARKLLLEIAPGAKDRLPKRSTRRSSEAAPAEPPAPAPSSKPKVAKAKTATKQPTKKKEKVTKKPTRRPPATKKSTKTGKKKTTKKKTTSRRLTKRKPR